MNRYEELFQSILRDARYIQNLPWGESRPGHPEGTVRAHIEELEKNLAALQPALSSEEYWKLRVLIHVHDSFKPEADKKVAISDPRSHASIAAKFLSEFCDDADLVAMVQLHDEPYALWRQWRERGECNELRLDRLLAAISDWSLFLRFCVIDGITPGKQSEPLHWMAEHIAGRVELRSLLIATLKRVEAGSSP